MQKKDLQIQNYKSYLKEKCDRFQAKCDRELAQVASALTKCREATAFCQQCSTRKEKYLCLLEQGLTYQQIANK